MLANAVKHTTTTSGTGALTLAAVANFLPFSQKFALNQPFLYSAYTGTDAAPVFREAGIGALTASNVMARLAVRETSDGTTSNTVTPTATDFAGATVMVICTPLAAFTESMLPAVDTQSASVARYLTSAARNGVTTSVGPTALRVYYVPFLLRVATPVTSLAINVTTLGSGVVARAGIYACNEKGYPGAMLASTGDLDCSSTGVKAGTLAQALVLAPGWYFAAFVISGTASVTAYTSNISNVIGGSPLGFTTASPPVQIDFRMETVASAVLPSAASTTTSASSVGAAHVPLVYFGV
jgi:hypothetical protein